MWLEADIECALVAGDQVPDIVKDVSIPPKFECRKFKSIWAFGYRFRVASYKKNLSTRDSGIAVTFSRPWRSSTRDRNLVEANVEYIGELEEIVELDYCQMRVVVFVCRWVKANYRGVNATVRRDRWGFRLANFQSCEHFGKESLVFPKHCEQVF